MKRYWITGASSGIGSALALALAARGDTVFASARSVDKLDRLVAASPSKIVALQCDVQDDAQVLAAIRQIEAAGGLDVAILNAGICEYVDVLQPDIEMFDRVMQTNFIGVVRTAFAALPMLRESRGRIVGVVSAAAYSGMPRAEAYGSSKAAVSHFLEALRVDVAASGVKVTSAFPGFVETPLSDRNDFPMPMRISSDQAASTIVKAIDRETDEVHFPWFFCAILRLIARAPSPLRTWLFSKMVRTDEATAK